MARFEDAPLGEGYFRLFKFRQGTTEIDLEVKTFKIHRAPTYIGISYCWGEKSDGTAMIACNGQPLEVWSNLHAVLRRLRHENSNDTNWYWNDALCIEQSDEEVAITEKGQQIASMETIFLLAEPVKVWLGDASREEEEAFQYLIDTCQKLAEKGVRRDGTGLPGPDDRLWYYWAQVTIRSWFTRLWIVQEFLVEGKVIFMLGMNGQATWASFHETIQRIRAVPWADRRLEYSKLDDRAKATVDQDFYLEWGISIDEYENRGRGRTRDDAFHSCVFRNTVNMNELMFLEKNYGVDLSSFQQVLKVYGNRKCTYDQDRPNAMRGVLPEQLKKGLRVFTIHEEITNVYREVSRFWLTNDPTLSLLQRIRPLRKFMPKSHEKSATRLTNPSWTIDLSRVVTEAVSNGVPNTVDGFHAGLVKTSSFRGKAHWEAPKPTSLISRMKGLHKNISFPNENQCHISGLHIGTVKSAITYNSEKSRNLANSTSAIHQPEFVQWLRNSFDLITATGFDENEAKEVHWRTLVLNQTNTSDPEVHFMFDLENKHSRLQEYTNMLNIIDTANPDGLAQSDTATKRFYNSTFLYQYDFPNWFSTSTGHIGRSLSVPQSGDTVAVFYGAAVPFLLRPATSPENGGCYEFMGEAYVHGVMQGEALLKHNEEKYPKTVFKLV